MTPKKIDGTRIDSRTRDSSRSRYLSRTALWPVRRTVGRSRYAIHMFSPTTPPMTMANAKNSSTWASSWVLKTCGKATESNHSFWVHTSAKMVNAATRAAITRIVGINGPRRDIRDVTLTSTPHRAGATGRLGSFQCMRQCRSQCGHQVSPGEQVAVLAAHPGEAMATAVPRDADDDTQVELARMVRNGERRRIRICGQFALCVGRAGRRARA